MFSVKLPFSKTIQDRALVSECDSKEIELKNPSNTQPCQSRLWFRPTVVSIYPPLKPNDGNMVMLQYCSAWAQA